MKPNEKKKYIVLVDDNFHYLDESSRYKAGQFDTEDEAIALCKRIVEESITYEEGTTFDELCKQFYFFGDSPYISGSTVFNAMEYAREHCEQLCREKTKNKTNT